jgi:hypothetical protein
MSSIPTVFPHPAGRCAGGYVRSIRGLEQARILQPGYAIEYDYVDPRSLDDTLQLKAQTACFSRGRSTARPDTKKRRRKGWSRV